jgi:hypothetical protein
MFLPWGYATLVARYFLSNAGCIRNTIRRMRWDQQLAPPREIDRAIERELILTDFVESNVRQSRHARVKMPPHYCSTLARSIFAEWGLVKANTRRGVFRVKK